MEKEGNSIKKDNLQWFNVFSQLKKILKAYFCVINQIE